MWNLQHGKSSRHLTHCFDSMSFQTQHTDRDRCHNHCQERRRDSAKQTGSEQQDEKCTNANGKCRPMCEPELVNEFDQSLYDSSLRYGVTKDLANLTEHDA